MKNGAKTSVAFIILFSICERIWSDVSVPQCDVILVRV